MTRPLALVAVLFLAACQTGQPGDVAFTYDDAIRIGIKACGGHTPDANMGGRWHARYHWGQWLVWYGKGDFDYDTYLYAVAIDAKSGEPVEGGCVLAVR